MPGMNGLLSLLVPSLWLTYFHFSKKFKAIFAPETAGNAPAPADETAPETGAATRQMAPETAGEAAPAAKGPEADGETAADGDGPAPAEPERLELVQGPGVYDL